MKPMNKPYSSFSLSSNDLTLSDLFKGDLQLSSPPAIYFQLKKVIDDPSKTMADAGNVIDKDPGLTIRLLKLVNSAFFGFPSQISTISRAISIIGTQELQNLVLGTLIIEKFSNVPAGSISLNDYWAQSVRTALAAKEISKRTQSAEKLETIFICGLLHEIGKLVLYRRIPELAREISLLIESSDETDSALERRLLGFDHYQVGSELSRLWKLPEVITESIAQHNAIYNTGPFSETAAIVRLAAKLSKMELEDSIDKELDHFNISQSLLVEIMNSVHDQFEEIFAIFYPKR